MEFEEMIETINKIVAVCEEHPCRTCPYWNKEKCECKIQMSANVIRAPYEW